MGDYTSIASQLHAMMARYTENIILAYLIGEHVSQLCTMASSIRCLSMP